MANPIVFSAYKNDGGFAIGDYMGGYNIFLANYGNSFEPSSGTFTAPRAGYFEFFASTHHAMAPLKVFLK